MKKIIIAFFLILLTAPWAARAESIQININDVVDTYVYNDAFEALVLDFKMISAQADYLNALTVTNLGYYQNIGFENMCLYLDAGPTGFQGWGADQALGCGTWDSGYNYWYWDNLNVSLNSSGVRLFAVVDTDQLSTTAKFFQIGIPALNDKNSDGKFELGEAGCFTANKNNGPAVFTGNATIRYLKYFYGDMLSPKAIFSNLTDNQVIEGDSFDIAGEAKDSGPIGLSWVKVSINGVIYNAQTTDNYAHWNFSWQNITPGIYTLKIQASDSNYNLFDGAPLIVLVKAKPAPAPAAASVDASSLPSATMIDYTVGTWVKIANDSSVYFLDNNNSRHAYPVLAVWQSYFGDDFSRVQTISAEIMATYSLGKNVPFKTNSLIKIPSVPKVYQVEDSSIRWIKTEAAAKNLFGDNWASLIKNLPESFFGDYIEGSAIE